MHRVSGLRSRQNCLHQLARAPITPVMGMNTTASRRAATAHRPSGKKRASRASPKWWTPPWATDEEDPDAGWAAKPDAEREGWPKAAGRGTRDDDAILAPLEAQFGQVRSRDRVRDLAEVFTHQREVDAMLDHDP